MNANEIAAVNSDRIETLGNILGAGGRYFGQCFWCGTQFMETSARLVRHGTTRFCVSCATTPATVTKILAKFPGTFGR
jgi:hypothetical protein